MIGNAAKRAGQRDLEPVEERIAAPQGHFRALKYKLGSHGGPVGIVQRAAFHVAPLGPQAKNIGVLVHGKGIFAHGTMKNSGKIHGHFILSRRRRQRPPHSIFAAG